MNEQNVTMEQCLAPLPAPLLDWYRANARDLPWRRTQDPYRIWVSEIMLQQTRVSAVLHYYNRFMAALPDVAALACVEEAALMKLWEGLGYYNRARNLRKAAQMVMEHYGGAFPEEYEQLLALPGVGEYTAGAIASIAFGKRCSAVDGNVLRVLARITGDTGDVLDAKVKRRFRGCLEQVLPESRCGDFNQALMELGAMVCLPNGAPRCEECPAASFCTARREGSWKELPVKRKKAPRKKEEKTVFVLLSAHGMALRRRPDRGLLAGLWEFPNVEGTLEEEGAAALLARWGLSPVRWEQQLCAAHIFTHVEWQMRCYVLRVRGALPEGFVWTDRAELARRAVPSAFARFMEAALSALGEEEA